MTNTTTAQQAPSLTIDAVLANAGFASIDDAREGNVFFGCLICGSTKTCTPGEGRTREQERDLLIENYEGMDECCGGPDAHDSDFLI